MYLRSLQPPKIGYGCSWQWYVVRLWLEQYSMNSYRSTKTKMVVFEHLLKSYSAMGNATLMVLPINLEGGFGPVCYSCVDNLSG